MVTKVAQEAIQGRRIHSWLELYENLEELVKLMEQSYRYGELSVLSERPPGGYLRQKIIDCFRDIQ
jgi:hypothetical protein